MLIGCKEASFGYEGKPAVSNLNFDVNIGDYLCVVGENGSGKSTLISGLLRLLPPLGGEVLIGEGLRVSEIGYLPQQTAAQKDFPASVFEVTLSGALGLAGARPFYSRKDRARARKNLEMLGVASLSRRCYRELSGGQQQRVLLARALCATTRLIILDEPVSGLDPLATAELYTHIERINRELGITVIMVSHDVGGALRYASHILHLMREPLFFGTTGEYLATPLGSRFAGGEGL